MSTTVLRTPEVRKEEFEESLLEELSQLGMSVIGTVGEFDELVGLLAESIAHRALMSNDSFVVSRVGDAFEPGTFGGLIGAKSIISILRSVEEYTGPMDDRHTNDWVNAIVEMGRTRYISPRHATVREVMKVPGALDILGKHIRGHQRRGGTAHAALNTLYGSLMGKSWSASSFISDLEPLTYCIVDDYLLTGEIDPYHQTMIDRLSPQRFDEIVADIESIDDNPLLNLPKEIISALGVSWKRDEDTGEMMPYFNQGV